VAITARAAKHNAPAIHHAICPTASAFSPHSRLSRTRNSLSVQPEISGLLSERAWVRSLSSRVATSATRGRFLATRRTHVGYAHHPMLESILHHRGFVRTHANPQQMDSLRERGGIGQRAMKIRFGIECTVTQHELTCRSAETANVREQVQMIECYLECLHASHREAGHGAMIAIGNGSEMPLINGISASVISSSNACAISCIGRIASGEPTVCRSDREPAARHASHSHSP
jgi:hypothetical protein